MRHIHAMVSLDLDIVTGVMLAIVEPDPAKTQYGSRWHHRVAKFEKLSVVAGMKSSFDAG